nr:MAG TPA: hypothetical protein [Caudoviricetes sp.]
MSPAFIEPKFLRASILYRVTQLYFMASSVNLYFFI